MWHRLSRLKPGEAIQIPSKSQKPSEDVQFVTYWLTTRLAVTRTLRLSEAQMEVPRSTPQSISRPHLYSSDAYKYLMARNVKTLHDV